MAIKEMSEIIGEISEHVAKVHAKGIVSEGIGERMLNKAVWATLHFYEVDAQASLKLRRATAAFHVFALKEASLVDTIADVAEEAADLYIYEYFNESLKREYEMQNLNEKLLEIREDLRKFRRIIFEELLKISQNYPIRKKYLEKYNFD